MLCGVVRACVCVLNVQSNPEYYGTTLRQSVGAAFGGGEGSSGTTRGGTGGGQRLPDWGLQSPAQRSLLGAQRRWIREILGTRNY